MPTPITITVNFIDLTGNAIQGYMEANIIPPTGVNNLFVSGLGIIAPKVSISLVGSSVSLQVWGNDVVVDAQDGAVDTYYNVSLFQSTGALIWNAAYLFTGSGPVNLVGYPILNPVPVPPGFIYPQQFPPGGLSGDVQYNNGGVFAGDGTFTFNSISKQVTIGGNLIVGALDAALGSGSITPASLGVSQALITNRVAQVNLNTSSTNYVAFGVINQDNFSGGGFAITGANIQAWSSNSTNLVENDTVFPSTIVGLFAQALHIGTGNLTGINNGPVGFVSSAAVRTATTVSSVTSIVADTGNGSGATIGTMTGLWIPSMGDSGSTITTARGIYIAPQTAGAATTWGIYVDGSTSNFFGGTGGTNAVQLSNTAAATSGASQSSPSLTLNGTYWTGSASAVDSWSIQSSVAAGTNGQSVLVVAHTGSTSVANDFAVTNANMTLSGTLTTGSAIATPQLAAAFVGDGAGTTYPVTSVATSIGSTAVYQATIPGGSGLAAGMRVTIAGFVTHTSNNGYFILASANTTSMTLYNASAVSETHVGTAAVDEGFINQSGYAANLGVSASFAIQGTAYVTQSAFEALPGSPTITLNTKGDAEDAAYLRILNNGSTGAHGLEIGAIIDGTGLNPVTLQLGDVNGGSAAVIINAPLMLSGATPTGTTGQLSFGNTTGFGNGSTGTAVTTTLKSTGTGPITPQTVVNYAEIDIAGTKYWFPLVR